MNGVRCLLQKRGLSLNPILTLYYIAPASFCFLSILWLFLEKDAVLAHPMVSPVTVRFRCCCCFLQSGLKGISAVPL